MKRDEIQMIDVIIDRLTDCLVKRENNTIVETEYILRTNPFKKNEYSKWNFDWSIPQNNGFLIYELFVKGNPTVQGRIALKEDGGVIYVDIIENAPHNIGHNGIYEGVGGHLFAIACQLSFEAGLDGFVTFIAKTNLIKHYQEKIHAHVMSGQRMYIDTIAAQELISRYLKGDV